MVVVNTYIEGLKVIEPKVFGDNRGFFMESWNQRVFENLVTKSPCTFVQDNHSKSGKGTLRGLHFQLENPQGKLVRVVSGEVFDVAVDLREESETFGQWFGVFLSSENNKQLWIPPGFAHGFYVTSETAEFVYKCTTYYQPSSEYSLDWDDGSLAIEWPIEGKVMISEKDSKGLSIDQIKALLLESKSF